MPLLNPFVSSVTLLVMLSSAALPGQAQVAGAPGKEAVLEAIGHKPLASDPHLRLQIKPWNARPGSFLALVYLTTANADLDGDGGVEAIRDARLQPTLVLLEMVNGHLTATAKSDGPEGLGKECREQAQVAKAAAQTGESDGSLCKGFVLDLAPYRISATETAIGVRTKTHEIYPAGESDSEELTLLKLAGHDLKPVFSETMSASSEQRGPNEMITTKASLQVSPHKTGDYFDLVLTETNRTDRLMSDSTAGYPGKTLVKRRFVWNGAAYTEVK